MRTETVLEIIAQCFRQGAADFQTRVSNAVLGMTVLTDYTNRTYRVDDIDFTQNPMSTFETKKGPISYVEYYKTKYNITIRDVRQPMLISKARERDLRGGKDQTVCLIPELCRATGLSDDMRKDFSYVQN